MSSERVDGQDLLAGCDAGEAREILWTGAGTIDTTIESTCGDPWFYGAGFVAGQAGFYGWYVVEVSTAGYYDLTVGGVPGGRPPRYAAVISCPSDAPSSSGMASRGGATETGLLEPGRHLLAISFAPQSAARGEATVRLEVVGPLP